MSLRFPYFVPHVRLLRPSPVLFDCSAFRLLLSNSTISSSFICPLLMENHLQFTQKPGPLLKNTFSNKNSRSGACQLWNNSEKQVWTRDPRWWKSQEQSESRKSALEQPKQTQFQPISECSTQTNRTTFAPSHPSQDNLTMLRPEQIQAKQIETRDKTELNNQEPKTDLMKNEDSLKHHSTLRPSKIETREKEDTSIQEMSIPMKRHHTNSTHPNTLGKSKKSLHQQNYRLSCVKPMTCSSSIWRI
jgi:hypothetical protein